MPIAKTIAGLPVVATSIVALDYSATATHELLQLGSSFTTFSVARHAPGRATARKEKLNGATIRF